MAVPADRPYPIRVLWLAKGLGPGGMERLLVNHARIGEHERFDYRAAYLVDRPDSVVSELEALGVVCTPLYGGNDLDPRWLARLRRLVIDEDIDVIHIHSPMPAVLTRPLVKVMDLLGGGVSSPGIVYTEHNSWDCYSRVTRVANAITYRLDDSQFAVSRDSKESVPARLQRHVEVLTHGIDLEAAVGHRVEREEARSGLNADERDVVIITVAHLRTEKAHDILLDAARTVISDHPEALFISVGHGPLLHEMVRRRDKLGLGDRFRFLGFRSDTLALMAGADVFCLSSNQEGLPVAFMEATALGLPTVATAVGGLVDHVVPGINGLLVESGNSAALAEALGTVIGDPRLRQRLAVGALEISGRFDAAESVAKQEEVYERIAGERRQRQRKKRDRRSGRLDRRCL